MPWPYNRTSPQRDMNRLALLACFVLLAATLSGCGGSNREDVCEALPTATPIPHDFPTGDRC